MPLQLAPGPINWVESTRFYSNSDNSFYPLAVFFNSANDPNVNPNQPTNLHLGQFCPVDLKVSPINVPADATAAMVAGLALITGSANLTIAMRAPGSTQIIDPTYYDQQSLSPFSSGGERSVVFNCVPLVNGVFEIALAAQKYPNDPSYTFPPGGSPAVGVNLKLEGFWRP